MHYLEEHINRRLTSLPSTLSSRRESSCAYTFGLQQPSSPCLDMMQLYLSPRTLAQRGRMQESPRVSAVYDLIHRRGSCRTLRCIAYCGSMLYCNMLAYCKETMPYCIVHVGDMSCCQCRKKKKYGQQEGEREA